MTNPIQYAVKLSTIGLLMLMVFPVLPIDKPKVMLAKVFHAGINVSEYWVSEKLDGVRARWDGQQLISRGGHVINAPVWFTKGFPDRLLDGELWKARGGYQKTVSIVRQQKPHPGWKNIKFMVFDLPDHNGNFTSRVQTMSNLTRHNRAKFLDFIPQTRITTEKELTQLFEKITSQGGEGLILHHKNGLYRSGRSKDLLKLKPYTDAEAIVIDYRAGKGKYAGKMGAIKVRTAKGKEFYIGSGFTDIERERPPAIGSLISYRHQGVTDNKTPRFAVFLRARDEH